MLTLKTLLIICPLVFLAGFVDAIAGGGGLISLPAYLLAGLPPHQAIATNKMSSTIGTCASTARYLKNGYVDWREARPFSEYRASPPSPMTATARMLMIMYRKKGFCCLGVFILRYPFFLSAAGY